MDHELLFVYADGKSKPKTSRLTSKMNKFDGKETPFGSFLKFTAHELKKSLSNLRFVEAYWPLKLKWSTK